MFTSNFTIKAWWHSKCLSSFKKCHLDCSMCYNFFDILHMHVLQPHETVSPVFVLWNSLLEMKVMSQASPAVVLEVKGALWGRRGQNCYVWVSDCGDGTFYNSLLNLILSSSSRSPPPSTYMPHYILKVNPINTEIMKQVELPRRLPLCEPARYFCMTASIWGDAVRPAAGALQLAALVFYWKWPSNHCFLLPKRIDAWWHKEKWEVGIYDWGNLWEAVSFRVCSLWLLPLFSSSSFLICAGMRKWA